MPMGELVAEHWVSRWEREADTAGLDRFNRDFWQAGDRWIAEQRH